ncbi:MAG: 50S ribosomal protein L3 [Candidatus Aenigmarchaeota archaeon]|nr:50S ribosomal protein L3 [Candidatus Aenigmarchaeota archaeon]MCK5476636.1 50S ribosomal protein L3 [Candidatus Aenigmarchaeota archaeon]
MSQIHNPRRGSLAFRPKVKANRMYGKVKSIKPTQSIKIEEFAGYKAGMTQVSYVYDKKDTPFHGKKVVKPVTIIEVPDLFVIGFRCYNKTETGLKILKDIIHMDNKSSLKRKILISKKSTTPKDKDFKEIEDKIAENQIYDIKLLVHTLPQDSGMTKKKPELFEMHIGGNSMADKFKFAKEKINKTLSIKDFIEEGSFIDVIGVTKGKGFAGSVKRWGVTLLAKKSQKVIRKAGNLGPWHPAKTQATVPQMGQLGFFNRVIYNLRILKIINEDNKDEVFAKLKAKPFKKYGIMKSSFVIVNGSVTGSAKRLIRMRKAIRKINGSYDETVSIKSIN